MLRILKPLHLYLIVTADGSTGHVHDFYFEDDTWKVRYMLALTGSWLTRRKVLIPTGALGNADWGAHTVAVALTREQIRHCPSFDAVKPVSRQGKIKLRERFGWPHSGTDSPPAVAPPLAETTSESPASKPATKAKDDPHLLSMREVTGYRVHASDGDLGRVKDFIADDTQWTIRYLVVDLSVWMPTKKVLIPPQWLSEIDFERRRVTVGLAQESIINSPEFHPTTAVNRAYEEKLYDYYGRPH